MSNSTTVKSFLKNLESSRVLTSEQCADVRKNAGSLASLSSILALCVNQGILSAWQTKQILKGNLDTLHFGSFKILEALGKGGMGTVFRAHDLRSDQFVALKIFHPHLLNERDARLRFRREATVLLRMHHPRIVKALEYGEINDLLYLTMPFLSGSSLAAYIDTHGTTTVELSCTIASDLGRAIEHAHEHSIIHRDIKPSNIQISPSGRATLLDLGIAKLHDLHNHDRTLTQTNELMGSVDYISPEQIRDPRLVDTRSDFYSLGCTLYHCLSGQPPFAGFSSGETIVKHLMAQPKRLEEINPLLPETLTNLVHLLLEKDPNLRPSSPEELIQAVTAVRETLGFQDEDMDDPSNDSSSETARRVDSPDQTTRTWTEQELETLLSGIDDSLVVPQQSVLPSPGPGTKALVTASMAIICVVAATIWFWVTNVGTVTVELPVHLADRARLFVDGRLSPGLSAELTPGQYSVRVEVDGFDPVIEEHKITRSFNTLIKPSLVALPGTKRATKMAEFMSMLQHDGSLVSKTEFRLGLRQFQAETVGYQESLSAGKLLSRLRWPIDELDRSTVSQQELRYASSFSRVALDGLVGIAGTGALHHWGSVHDIEFLNGSQSIIAGGEDSAVRIWNTSTGECMSRFWCGSHILQVGHYQSTDLIMVNSLGQVGVFDTESDGPELISIAAKLSRTSETALAVANRRPRFAVGNGIDVSVVDIKTRQVLARLPDHTVVGELMFSMDDRWLFVADGESLFQYDTRNWQVSHRYDFEAEVTSIDVAADSEIAVGTASGSLMIYGVESNERRLTCELPDSIGGVAYESDGNELIVASGTRVLRSIRATNKFEVRVDTRSEVTDVEISDDGELVAVIGCDSAIDLYETKGWIRRFAPDLLGGVEEVEQLNDQSLVATISSGHIAIHDFSDGLRLVTPPRDLRKRTHRLAVRPDGWQMLTGGPEAKLSIWDLPGAEYPQWGRIFSGGAIISDLDWSHDGSMFGVSIESGAVVIFDAKKTKTTKKTFRIEDPVVLSGLAFSPDDTRIVAVSQFGDLFEWEIENDQRRVFRAGARYPTRIKTCYSPDGRYLVTTTGDRSVTLVDCETFDVAFVTRGHRIGKLEAASVSVTFSPDAERFVSAGTDGTINVWDLTKEPPIHSQAPIILEGEIRDVTFTTDGRHLVTGNSNGTIYIFRLSEFEQPQ